MAASNHSSDKMSVKFSSELLSQLGGQVWQSNPQFFAEQTASACRPVEKDETAILKPPSSQFTQLINAKTDSTPKSHDAVVEVAKDPKNLENSSTLEAAKVFIANGIDEIWQNEDVLAWRLWENIQSAFGWGDDSVHFFDASTMVSEDSLMACLEEVMALPIEQVYVMLDEHPIMKMLAEGLEVVELPSLDQMLDDPYAKQQFYQTIVQSL